MSRRSLTVQERVEARMQCRLDDMAYWGLTWEQGGHYLRRLIRLSERELAIHLARGKRAVKDTIRLGLLGMSLGVSWFLLTDLPIRHLYSQFILAVVGGHIALTLRAIWRLRWYRLWDAAHHRGPDEQE